MFGIDWFVLCMYSRVRSVPGISRVRFVQNKSESSVQDESVSMGSSFAAYTGLVFKV